MGQANIPSQVRIDECDATTYRSALVNADTDVFLTPAFNELNRRKVDDIKYLLFKRGTRPMGGMIAGVKDNVISSPFSAPYGGLLLESRESLNSVEEMADSFVEYCRNKNLNCRITFPAPVINDRTTNANTLFQQSLLSKGFQPTYTDINFHIEVGKNEISRNVRRGFLKGQSENYQLSGNEYSPNVLAEIYPVLKSNHEALGHPMLMEMENYAATSAVAKFRLFTVKKGKTVVAGGIAYETRDGVLQMISWGDYVETRSKVGPMSFMACEIFKWVEDNMSDIKIIDLGPSSSNGIPSAGLCDFKLKLGAIPTLKQTIGFKCS